MASSAAVAQNIKSYPEKPVRVVIPVAPGGAADIITRAYGQKFADGCLNDWGGGDYRDLMKGEELPHSSVDAMKWLAGYWGGTQDDDNTDDSSPTNAVDTR